MARKDLVARIGRLAKAVAITDRKGDDAGVEKWSIRLADASTTLAVMVNPELAEEPDGLRVYDHVLTWDEEYAIFLDAADEYLKAAGRPYGREGAERGAMPMGTLIDICEEHNLPLLLAQYRALVDPGVSQ